MIKKTTDKSCLVTKTVLNTKISEVESKIPDNSKYITNQEFNGRKFAATLKQANLVNKTDFDNELRSFNKQITSNKTKHLEIQKKINNLIKNDYHFFQGRIYFKIMMDFKTFFYQPIFDTLQLKKGKVIDYVLSWKSKGVYNSELKPSYAAFLHRIKLSGHRIGTKFDNDPSAVEQNNYLSKIFNVYIVLDLDA